MTRLAVRCFGLALAVVILAYAPGALACACCAAAGWRYVEIEKLSPRRTAELNQMRFASAAKLMLGESDMAIKGIPEPSEDYQLAVARQKDRFVFSFRDAKGRTGTLALAMPKSISIFEVDPRGGEKDTGLGPNLYKEWKLTANAAGDGMFRAVVGAGQKVTLVLHGRGNGCTSADQFSDWTLVIHGPAQKFTMYGSLETSK